MVKIFLVRHGESEANAKGLHQGQRLDTSLSKKGLLQAKKTSERLKDEKIDAIFASDLLRAKETAEEIARPHKLKIVLDKRLREFDMGDFTELEDKWRIYQDYKEVEAKKQSTVQYKVKTPNGESEWDHLLRVESFLNDLLKKKYKTVVVVAHGGTNKIFFGVIDYVSKDQMYSIPQSNCCINEVDYDGKNLNVHRVNCIKHLGD